MAPAKPAWKIGTAVIVAAVAIPIAVVLFGSSAWRMMHPVPELARDLPNGMEEASRLFEQRLQQRFPIGSSAKAMADQLRAEGFEVGLEDPNGEGWARFVIREWRCKTRWEIVWQKGAQDDLVKVRGWFGQMCV